MMAFIALDDDASDVSEVEVTYAHCEAVGVPCCLASSHLTGKDLSASSYSVCKVPYFVLTFPKATYTDMIRKPRETTEPCIWTAVESGSDSKAVMNSEVAVEGAMLPIYGMYEHICTTKIAVSC